MVIRLYFRQIYRGRYVLLSLVGQDLKSRYRNSLLGVAWNFLTPLGLVSIIGFVYSIVFKTPLIEFIPYLFSGLLPWIFFTSSAEGGAISFLGSQGYIKQTQVPIEIFPLRVSLLNLFNFGISIAAFFLIYVFLDPESFSIRMFMLVPATLIWFLFCSAWATISAIINLYVRDFQPLQSLAVQGLFYFSPIIYKPEMLKEQNFEWVYLYNPMYYLIEIVRNPLLGKGGIELNTWLIAIGITSLLVIIAITLISVIGRKITFKL
ncbi:ABC transporter permease [Cohnella sp. GCM10012308]|uniref:ABC transporter permease n=1 Tax=Cohnella sp. GCM10012308 TaxID=3317329 RepID=UPI00361A7DCC